MVDAPHISGWLPYALHAAGLAADNKQWNCQIELPYN